MLVLTLAGTLLWTVLTLAGTLLRTVLTLAGTSYTPEALFMHPKLSPTAAGSTREVLRVRT